MGWEVRPEPQNADERAALVAAAERAVAGEAAGAWWRSGLDDLGDGPDTKELWGQAGVIETGAAAMRPQG